MSLDIYLQSPNLCHTQACRLCGNDQLSIHPIEIARFNLTHNLNKMASEAGLYECLWRPEENGILIAHQAIGKLKIGLQKLTENPNYFYKFTPKNKCGTYEHLVGVVTEYLKACEDNPNAIIEVCR